MQNVDNNTLQESREMISIMWTQSFVHRKKLKEVTVMVKVTVVMLVAVTVMVVLKNRNMKEKE